MYDNVNVWIYYMINVWMYYIYNNILKYIKYNCMLGICFSRRVSWVSVHGSFNIPFKEWRPKLYDTVH